MSRLNKIGLGSVIIGAAFFVKSTDASDIVIAIIFSGVGWCLLAI